MAVRATTIKERQAAHRLGTAWSMFSQSVHDQANDPVCPFAPVGRVRYRINAEQRVENVACLEIVLDRARLYRRTKKLVEGGCHARRSLREESGV